MLGYRCTGCGHVWRRDTTAAVELRAKVSRRVLRWALEGVVVAHLKLGVSQGSNIERIGDAAGIACCR